jgi:hypothetical protein
MSYPNYSWTSAIGRQIQESRDRAEAERLIHGLDAHVAICKLTRDLGADTNCLVCQAYAFIKKLMAVALPPAPEVKAHAPVTVESIRAALADHLAEHSDPCTGGEWPCHVARSLGIGPDAKDAIPQRYCDCIGAAAHPDFVRPELGRAICMHCDLPREDAIPPGPEGATAVSTFDDLLGRLAVEASRERSVEVGAVAAALNLLNDVKEAIRLSWKCAECGYAFGTVGHLRHAMSKSEADASPVKEERDGRER